MVSSVRRLKNEEQEKQFSEELIRPCLCDSTWHRKCIRELIVKTESIQCPICQYQYTVGYSDCLAIFNKKRPNYLFYMLGQEILFFVSLWLFSLAAWGLISWWVANETVFARLSFQLIITTLSWACIILSVILFGARIKAKYSFREIEDIVVYDRSQKQTLDFDSPAILEVYFQELRNYEDQPYYYKKDVQDNKKRDNFSIQKLGSQYRRANSNPL